MSDSIYNFKLAQSKWTKILCNYSINNSRLLQNVSKKYYVLSMLPYPSGNLHMGHIRNYTIGDVIARVKRMQGYYVIQPIGFDSFGMPAENAAIKSGVSPKNWTEQNISDMTTQLHTMGYAYDWNRTVNTHSSEYYIQEQKMFLKFWEMGLAYRKQSYVNWDPVDCTVLANEQVIDGKGWRSGARVERKLLEQWSIKITRYAEELLSGLKALSGHWPEKVLKMQENWIGKSQGAVIKFKLSDSNESIEVYSTRPDTLFGASFVAISPDHPIAQQLANRNAKISNFITECKKNCTTEADLERSEKRGIDTKLFVEHPIIENKLLPVYIANFVLMEYGTGAVFACPAHDERDYDFAKKYNLPITPVIECNGKLPYLDDGIHINSEFLNGLHIAEAKDRIINYLEENNLGKRKITYRLRDWLVSRQRYWGCPIPIIHCKRCGLVPADLPVLLPDDIDFKGMIGGNPLESHPTWKYVKCPKCGQDAVRDTDTLDTFFESSWYYLRYLDPHNSDPINKELVDIAIPVDICIGGVEHAVLHLLYARFFMLALRDAGYINKGIPFENLLCQGMVCHKSYKNENGDWLLPSEVKKNENGVLFDKSGLKVTEYPSEKMSKSKKNVISPEEIIAIYGIDALRLFILSDTPPEKDFEWNTSALDGSWRFLNRVWRTFNRIQQKNIENNAVSNTALIKTVHIYLKKITQEYETISLNKAIALARELFNKIEDNIEKSDKESLIFAFETFIKIFSPITPFLCQEIWDIIHPNELVQDSPWPKYDESQAISNNVIVAIQVNGKLKGIISVPKDTENLELEQLAVTAIKGKIEQNSIEKIIVVPNKIVNVVV